MTIFVNGLHAIIRTQITRFREVQHRDEMELVRLTQKYQDIGNTFRLHISQVHSLPAKSTSAATAKISPTVRSTRNSPPPLQVHFMEININTGEELFLADDDSITNPENSIDTVDLPSTTTVNSE